LRTGCTPSETGQASPGTAAIETSIKRTGEKFHEELAVPRVTMTWQETTELGGKWNPAPPFADGQTLLMASVPIPASSGRSTTPTRLCGCVGGLSLQAHRQTEQGRQLSTRATSYGDLRARARPDPAWTRTLPVDEGWKSCPEIQCGNPPPAGSDERDVRNGS